jgi:hypothetical protein
VVEGTGLENRQARKRLEGSNPSLSATISILSASGTQLAMELASAESGRTTWHATRVLRSC